MSDGIFNIAKGSFVEKIRDSATDILLLLLKANEAEATLVDRTDVADMLIEAGTTEADFANYARKTGIEGTILIDDTNNLVDVDIPDQTFASATTGQDLTKAILAYEETATEAGRIPLSHHDAVDTTDGNDLVLQINTEGFGRAA